jgi:3-hydroxyisobutyrate dehydrogenase-like beta-hydroxyacid dehydrogenase
MARKQARQKGSGTVAFIGLGAMGSAMAANLLAAGHALRVYNRTRSKAARLAAKGARVAATPAEAVEPGGVVVTMLADDGALEEVTVGEGGFAERLGEGGVHLSMSTISPALGRRLADLHRELGTRYVAAPVFGRPEAAEARKLWVCVSGDRAAVRRVRPLLEALGQGTFDFGSDPSAAHVVKLAGNFLIASVIEGLAEAVALVRGSGVEPTAFVEMLGRTLFACPAYQNYGRLIVEERYEPAGFRLALGLKDAELVLAAASAAGAPMPFADAVRRRFLAAVSNGRGDLDWAAIALGAAEEAGLGRPSKRGRRNTG